MVTCRKCQSKMGDGYCDGCGIGTSPPASKAEIDADERRRENPKLSGKSSPAQRVYGQRAKLGKTQ